MTNIHICIFLIFLVNITYANKDKAQLLRTVNMTCYTKQRIVNAHNKYRNSSAFIIPAKNMRKIYWDEELAQQAQTRAMSLTFERDKPGTLRTKRFDKVGQIIWQTITEKKESSSKGTMKFKQQIKEWFNEGLKYNGTPNENVTRFTQLLWDDTFKVGCGFSYYKKRDYFVKFYVCNYGPSGNINGKYPYQHGIGCDRSDNAKSSKYKGLCATIGEHDLPCSRCFVRKL